MRTIRTKVYQFSELSEQAKQKAVENMYDINISHEWWEYTYEDAANVGLKITAFDTGRSDYCDIEFIEDSNHTMETILKEHGEDCSTYKTALNFKKEWAELVEKYSDGVNKDKVSEDNEYEFDNEADELEKEFLKSLGEDYLTMLRNDYEYQTSEEAIIDTIEANEYEFTKEGNQF